MKTLRIVPALACAAALLAGCAQNAASPSSSSGSSFASSQSSSSTASSATSLNEDTLTEYAIVQVDLDWTYSQAQLEAGPQLGEGRYLRYFLLGKTEKIPEFRWYELYWDDFLEEA